MSAPGEPARPALLGHLAAACRQVREEQGVPRARLAELVGVERTAIFRFERARSWPKHPGRVVDGYARVCAVSPQLIWGRAIKALADTHPPARAHHAQLRAVATQLL